ncbi:hypothetical protein BDV95DRAFT_486651, partial [Massariosphaeria phaeospora]
MGSPRPREPYLDTVTTTIFISNLHCPSCIDSIGDTLNALHPAPAFISHSIVSHSVVVRHHTSLAVHDISGSLEAAGFEIHSIFQGNKTASDPIEIPTFQKHDAVQEHDVEWRSSLQRAVERW